MHIALNAILLDKYNSGVENYIANLLSEFNQLLPASRHKITAFFKSTITTAQWAAIQRVVVPDYCREKILRIAWEHFYFSSNKLSEFDLIHAPGYIAPYFPKIPIVLTVHDLHVLTHPHLCSMHNRFYYRLFLPKSIKQASRIITPSNFVTQEIRKLFESAGNKIFVIPEAVREIFRTVVDEKLKQQVAAKYGLPEKFLLFVGNIEPKKNVPLLVSIYEKLSEKFPGLGLVLAGRWGWESTVLKRNLIRLQEMNPNVILTHYLPTENLAVIYNLATIFVFPSLIEGFGVPPLEAMACGTPVVTSNRGAIPEVVGDAAIVIDPEKPNEYFTSIQKLLEEPSFAEELQGRGWERVKKFSWKKTAQQTLDVYETFKTNI